MCSCDNHMLLITGQLIFSPSIIITLKPNIFKEGVGSWGRGHTFSPPPYWLCFASHCSTPSLSPLPKLKTCILYHVYVIMHAASNKT